MKDEVDFLNGLDTLVQFIAEKDKADEIHIHTLDLHERNSKNSSFERIIQDIVKVGFKWNSTVKNDNDETVKDIYGIKLRFETLEDYTKKNW